MSTDPFRCSSLALALGEPMYGTASTVTNWVLLERPGPWGFNAAVESKLSGETARAILRRARELRIRLVLLRRPGRHVGQGAHCYFVHTGPEDPWMEHVQLEHPEQLLGMDLSPLGVGVRTGLGDSAGASLFLVCTNGARDPCCAERGRPLAFALEKQFGGRVWECSHIGGDRFAPNLISFPYGLYFGRVTPAEGPAVARSMDKGLIDLDHYRGRSCFPFDVQAAEHFARREWNLQGIDDLAIIGRTHVGPAQIEVAFAGPSESRLTVRISISPAEPPRLLTCKSTVELRPPQYEIRGRSSAASV